MPTGDRIQMQLSSYAAGLAYERLDEQTVHAAKVRIIDTIGALVGGFAGEPCRIAREVAVQMPNPHGASVIGTNIRTSPDVAAFVNGTTARYVEMNDVYHWPGSAGGHPSDVLMPIYQLLDRAPYGRNEDGFEVFPMEWVRRHDEYEEARTGSAA